MTDTEDMICLLCEKKIEGLNFYVNPNDTKKKICNNCYEKLDYS